MNTVIGIGILLLVVFLTVCAIFAWIRAAQEKGFGFYVGAWVTTLMVLFAYWFVFLSGLFS